MLCPHRWAEHERPGPTAPAAPAGPGDVRCALRTSEGPPASTSLPSFGEEVAGGGCTWTMTVEIPRYVRQRVITGGSRGDIAYGRDDLESYGWEVGMSIGDDGPTVTRRPARG